MQLPQFNILIRDDTQTDSPQAKTGYQGLVV